MEKEEIKAKVLSSISDVSDGDNHEGHLDLDSFALMTLLVSLSRKFSVSFNPSDITRMKKIESIVTLIEEKLNQKGS